MRKPSRRLIMCLFVAALAVTGGSQDLWAQFTSSIEGTVVDSSGARIPKATVVAVNGATGIKSTTETNSVGYFLLPSLPPGSFRLTVSIAGFKTTEVSDVVIELDQRGTLNLSVDVGSQATTV